MRRTSCGVVCLCSVLAILVATAWGESPRVKDSGMIFVETPRAPLSAPEIGGSMFKAAAVNTAVLGWWQFDGLNGTPNKQGWTEQDMTLQLKKYWHVAGTSCPDATTPFAGSKSMWCGQWNSTADPFCAWATLPGYGDNWDQSLESLVSYVNVVTYSIAWDSEPGYDYTYIEWFDPAFMTWIADPIVNGGSGSYTGSGYLQTETSTAANSGVAGPTKVRFHFVSNGSRSDQDGLWPTVQGAVTLDDISINGGPTETFEGAGCGALVVGNWRATTPAAGFGNYAHLVHGSGVVQEDPCLKIASCLWAFFDDPATTNYACGGWPLQGAVPYGPNAQGLYLSNEIWSPWVPISGLGSEYILSFLTYGDLPLQNLVFYVWHVRAKDTAAPGYGCPGEWNNLNAYYYGEEKEAVRADFQIGAFVGAADDQIQIALGAVDMCGVWGGVYGDCSCHSHTPLFDQVRLAHVETWGPQYVHRDIDMWQDNFPELGGVSATSYARCDMAQDIIPSSKQNILPGDSLKITVSDPMGLAADNTGGRPGEAVYVFVKVTDRFENPQSYTGLQVQSPDDRAYAGDPNTGSLRWPLVSGITVFPPAGWNAYRMDRAYAVNGSRVPDAYCADLMDLADGPHGPPYHPNENEPANTGVFIPGDIVWYFIGAKNTLGQWSFTSRTYRGQGGWFRTNDVNRCTASPMEWSVLPDAGRNVGDLGDILYVDDADDRGGPAQIYFDWAFKYYGLQYRVDRFDVLDPSSCAGNSLASRVKNVRNQIIGDPVEIYQKVLWNCSDLSRGLMGDGGVPNRGFSAEKSDDFGLCYTFLDSTTNNPGWAYWGDDVVEDWNTMIYLGPPPLPRPPYNATRVYATYMNRGLASGDQETLTGSISPGVYPPSPLPPWPWFRPAESFVAFGGCPSINDFDYLYWSGLSTTALCYGSATSGPAAALSQVTPNPVGSTARFFLAGFGFNFIRDDDTVGPPDYVLHLGEILRFFQNETGNPIGIDPIAFENRLDNNYPNPFNPTTAIKFSIAERGRVSLKIYNAAGQLVRTLVDEEKAPRAEGFSVSWDGTNNTGGLVASGVYFYQLTAQNFSQTKKMVLLK